MNLIRLLCQAGVVLASIAISPLLVLWAWFEAWKMYGRRKPPSEPMWHHMYQRHYDNRVESN